MTDIGDDLQATSEAIAADAARLHRIEERKQSLSPDDPEVATLAAEAERLARELVPKTVAERELADEAAAEAAGEADGG